MAGKIEPINCNAMIEALNTFASKTSETSSELAAACASCTSVLGEGDLAGESIAANARAIALKYAELAEKARAIAGVVQEELDAYYEEQGVWTKDVGEDDGF